MGKLLPVRIMIMGMWVAFWMVYLCAKRIAIQLARQRLGMPVQRTGQTASL